MVNCFLIVDTNSLTLVDTGLPGNDKKIVKYIIGLGHNPGNLRRILITHSDIDHFGSLAELKAATGARVFASEIEAEAITEGRTSRKKEQSGLSAILLAITRGFIRAKSVNIEEYLSDGQVLPVFGGLRVVATPGHTPGHLSFYAPAARILFAGDSLISRNGYLRGPSAIISDREDANASVKHQAALGAEIVCAAHGEVVMNAMEKFPLA
jgi:glyoxylase-like metal-dependent hydrolase (beta-lactamase superfamily II)